MTKICRICKIPKNDAFFYKNEHSNRCKACEQARKRNERKIRTHSIPDRRSYLKKVHNITLEQYQEIEKKQNGKCAICQGVGIIKKGNLCVDHDHKTGKIRGLLCHSCNVGIGHFEDKIELLKKAIRYITSNG